MIENTLGSIYQCSCVLATSFERLIRSIWNTDFDTFSWLWRYFLVGAVIPIWIIMRLLNAPSGK